MIQRREDFRFALKACQSVGVGCERRWEDLDGDLTLQLRVRRPIYLPHPTHAELRGDFVDAEAGAGRESQEIFVDYTGGTAGRTDYSCVTPQWRLISSGWSLDLGDSSGLIARPSAEKPASRAR